ncbi:hypothetical protein [uncultured Sneathiella sp.]|jgi:hypothetical protein|uniref:hypothetical protein n=1 Tax=uncultured Sneathiella sp. TaxID=879315 RepID=UPI0030D72333|tara:strand:- start:250 stop:678 length:429 start_codon:yes stop_codon:yes gene_type:complete
MAIDPLVLLPAAGIAVLIVIIYIRLVAGRRDARLTTEELDTFLRFQEPERTVARSALSEDGKYALIRWCDGEGIGLVRGFGDKLVYQSLTAEDLSKCTLDTNAHALRIPRQGFAFPPIIFRPAAADTHAVEALIKGETDAAA